MKKKYIAIILITILMANFGFGVKVRAAETEPESEPVLLETFDPYEDPEPIVVWDDEETTNLAYVNPRNWGHTYNEEGSERCVVKCGQYLLEVTPQGEKGPVWKYTDYCGELVGVTANTFVFQEDGCLIAVYWGEFYEERMVKFEELPEQEQKTFRSVVS